MNGDERTRHLMMAALDDELSREERDELDRRLAEDASLRAEWDRLRRVKEVTGTMGYSEPPPEVWDDYWTGVYRRFERGAGWLLISLGAVVLFAFAAWHWIHSLLSDTTLPGYVKIAVFALVVGAAILFVSVVREKYFMRRKDRYSRVQR